MGLSTSVWTDPTRTERTNMHSEKTGTIFDSIDAGSVVVVFIHTSDGLEVVHADGNLWRKAEGMCEALRSVNIEYEATNRGGLAWFRPLEPPATTW